MALRLQTPLDCDPLHTSVMHCYCLYSQGDPPMPASGTRAFCLTRLTQFSNKRITVQTTVLVCHAAVLAQLLGPSSQPSYKSLLFHTQLRMQAARRSQGSSTAVCPARSCSCSPEWSARKPDLTAEVDSKRPIGLLLHLKQTATALAAASSQPPSSSSLLWRL
jgi:hypothetical protein